MLGTGVGIKVDGKGIREMTGRADISAENIRCGEPAFHPSLPGEKRGFDFRFVFEPAGIHHTAYV